ncbi:MAG: RNA polymerase sporulation sigma factor SigK [Roseburia sp.]|nr:RNA polymerase sporulation sigma factor SigK [Roseburia sp.]
MKTFLSPFTPEQENECLKRIRDGDPEARKELILRNMRLVAHVAKKYQNSDEDMEDLISIGTIGLIKAISTYRDDYGSRLATYAARCIDNELLMHFRARKKTSREVSLYEPIGTDKEGNQISLLDIVESEEPDVVERLELERCTGRVLSLVPRVLSGRELFIIVNRYGLFDKRPMTQREIASVLKISRSYVSRIEKRALGKLRRSFAEEVS